MGWEFFVPVRTRGKAVKKDLVNKGARAALPGHNFGRRDFSKEGGCVCL
jgi:hypothetical protein